MPSEWNDDDYDTLAEGVVVGRIMEAAASPVGAPWLHRHPRICGATREAAMAAFAKNCGNEAFLTLELAKINGL